MGIAELLGLSRGSEFFAAYGEQDEYGYTYRPISSVGDLTLENAVLKIILDPQGYTAGLVSSFTPNVGMALEEEKALLQLRKQNRLYRNRYPGNKVQLYTKYTRKNLCDNTGNCVSPHGAFYYTTCRGS